MKDVFSFARSETLKIESVNVDSVPIAQTVSGKVVFAAEKVVSPSSGQIVFVKDNGAYVDKGTLIARIQGKEFSTDVLSPARGIFIWDELANYIRSYKEIGQISDSDFICDRLKQGQSVKSSQIIGSIATNDDFYLMLDTNSFTNVKIVQVVIDSVFTSASGSVVQSNATGLVVDMSKFFNELYDKKQFTVISKVINGFRVNANDIVKSGGVSGIYIVNGNRLKFLPVEVYDVSHQTYVSVKDENFASFSSFLIVRSPLMVREGEVIGSF
ncbi:MAG: hypothetical protein ACP5SB_00745 [Caldisericaceae bacterium]